MTAIAERAATMSVAEIANWALPEAGGRASAVLILIGEGEQGPDVLLVEKAARLRNHAGQPAFPGGGTEVDDADPTETALREAAEEVGVDPRGVTVVGTMPMIYLAPSGYIVTPVLGYWHTPAVVSVLDAGEIASVARVPIAELADPLNRFRVRHPSGYVGAAFGVAGMVVWGFTALLLSSVLDLGGWTRPWDSSDVRDLDSAMSAMAATTERP